MFSGGKGCQCKRIRHELIESAVIDALMQRNKQIADLAAKPPEVIKSPEIITLESQLSIWEHPTF